MTHKDTSRASNRAGAEPKFVGMQARREDRRTGIVKWPVGTRGVCEDRTKGVEIVIRKREAIDKDKFIYHQVLELVNHKIILTPVYWLGLLFWEIWGGLKRRQKWGQKGGPKRGQKRTPKITNFWHFVMIFSRYNIGTKFI